jgi:hypothetical protein
MATAPRSVPDLSEFCAELPSIEVRVLRRSEIPELASIVRAGLSPEAELPVTHEWYGVAYDEVEAAFAVAHEQMLDSLGSTSWVLPLVARSRATGRPIGMQYLHAEPTYGSVRLSSWLARSENGKGFDHEMRSGALHVAFYDVRPPKVRNLVWERDGVGRAIAEDFSYQWTSVLIDMVGTRQRQFMVFELDRRRYGLRSPMIPMRSVGFDAIRASLQLPPVAERQDGAPLLVRGIQ